MKAGIDNTQIMQALWPLVPEAIDLLKMAMRDGGDRTPPSAGQVAAASAILQSAAMLGASHGR